MTAAGLRFPGRRVSAKRANSSAAVPHSMIQSPTSASRSGSATSASTAARRRAVSSSNFRAACRRSSPRASARPCSIPSARPCSRPCSRPSSTHSAIHSSLCSASSVSTSSSRGGISVGDQRASVTGANGSTSVAHSTIPSPTCVSRSGSAISVSRAAVRCAPDRRASITRANSSAAVPHSMIQSPTSASRSGSATSASTAARRRAVSSSNFRAACRRSSPRASARPCSSPSARPCSSPRLRPSATHSAVHSCTVSDSMVSTSFRPRGRYGRPPRGLRTVTRDADVVLAPAGAGDVVRRRREHVHPDVEHLLDPQRHRAGKIGPAVEQRRQRRPRHTERGSRPGDGQPQRLDHFRPDEGAGMRRIRHARGRSPTDSGRPGDRRSADASSRRRIAMVASPCTPHVSRRRNTNRPATRDRPAMRPGPVGRRGARSPPAAGACIGGAVRG